MRCPACSADNPDGAASCAACGTSLPETGPSKPLGVIAYQCAVLGLIPLAGLVFGPLALILGLIAWRRKEDRSSARISNHALAAMVLGSLISMTNWLGLTLMVIAVGPGDNP